MNQWLQTLKAANQGLMDAGLVRQLKVRSTPNAAQVIVNGEERLAFVSNDYLGLSFHPSLIAVSMVGSKKYGTGSGASSLISGHTQVHADLEKALAATQVDHIPDATASFISTGFMANLAVITALSSLGPISVFSDALNHASMIDGIRLAKASNKNHPMTSHIYPHGDHAGLKHLLQEDPHPLKLIVSDGVFSMDGEIANIPKLLELAEEHDALLYIDDAHGFGVLGAHGHGSLEHFQLHSPNFIYMGTLGKAAGVAGAFVVAQKVWIDWLIQKARPIIYSTAPAPNQAFALLHSLELITGEVGIGKRQHLNELIEYWNTHAHFKHWQTNPSIAVSTSASASGSASTSTTAIQPLILGSNAEVLRVASRLLELGIWVPAIRPPTVPLNTARLRIAFNAHHQIADIDRLIKALLQIEENI